MILNHRQHNLIINKTLPHLPRLQLPMLRGETWKQDHSMGSPPGRQPGFPVACHYSHWNLISIWISQESENNLLCGGVEN